MNMPSIERPFGPVLRSATEADVGDVLRLIRELAQYERMLEQVTATETDIRQALFGPLPRIHAVLAEVGNTAIGLALYYYTFNTFKARPNIFLEDLFVEQDHRGSGIGLSLMRHLAQLAVAEGCRQVEWRVLTWNQPSIEFYQRIGAEPMDRWHTLMLSGDALAALAEGTSHG